MDEKLEANSEVDGLFKTTDKRNVYSKDDTTIRSHGILSITQVNNDTVPSSRRNCLPKKFNEALLRKTGLTRKRKRRYEKK